MDELLKPVMSTKSRAKKPSQPIIVEVVSNTEIKDADGALETLRSSPDSSGIRAVLHFLAKDAGKSWDAKIVQITNILVSQTIPDWWEQLSDDPGLSKLKFCLTDHFREATALSSLVSRLKSVTTLYRSSSQANNGTSPIPLLKVLLEVLAETLSPEDIVLKVHQKCMSTGSHAHQAAVWKEFISLISSGRLIAAVAEAEDVLRSKTDFRGVSWLGRGKEFCKWLARNVAFALVQSSNADMAASVYLAPLIGKALMLGYQDTLVGQLLELLVFRENPRLGEFKKLIQILPLYQQRTILLAVLQYIDGEYLASTSASIIPLEDHQSTEAISNCAALVKEFTAGIDMLEEFLSELCVKVENSILMRSRGLRRTVLAALSHDEERLATIVEKAMIKFGDQLFIQHAPMVQQEALAQILLLTSGYIHSCQPMLLFTITKSSTQTHCTSNRLKASSPRAQWLGMIVAMALSGLTDKPGSKLVFNDEAMQSKEAKWYQSLVNVHDIIGDFKHLQVRVKREVELVVPGKGRTAHSLPSRLKSKSKNEMIKIRDTARQSARIIELSDGEEEDDDDIIPYAKPDSDPEDEDDDPTLVERNKPRSPVYVRDLLAGLRDLENYDRHRLALETSSALIRRKATFGKEVSDHAEELTSVLLNLNNQFELDDFLDLRQEALISLTVSQPKLVAPYIAHSCFEGSYSVQQRAAMLTALALGARELAGFRDEARSEPPKFPSKELPKHLQQIYNEQSASRLGRAADQLEQAMVEPMALNAADQISGPNALKVRTFSSRIDMQKKKVKSITSSLTKDMIQWFFIPLIGGWWAQMQNFNNRSATFSKHLLPLYLRTLAVILHASGPSTLALPQITTEFWDLLLSLRTNALNENDVKILDALLFAFLTLLELNEDKQRLADEHAKELVETQEWAKLVLSQYTSAINSDQDEGGKVKMLAAAVVVKCHEVVERWQRLMLGDLVDM